ncbi:MAG: PadR family transcriptional regulator [Paracoccaceae bacterium]
MEYTLNNTELALLSIISECGSLNGYQLKRTVDERGLQAWAGVSASSIYVVLKKLEKRGFVFSSPDTNKRSRGPRGQIFVVTDSGKQTLQHEIKGALSGSREHDARYNIALSNLAMLPQPEFLQCCVARLRFLKDERKRISERDAEQTNQPLGASLLFQRILNGMDAEIFWTTSLIANLKQQKD